MNNNAISLFSFLHLYTLSTLYEHFVSLFSVCSSHLYTFSTNHLLGTAGPRVIGLLVRAHHAIPHVRITSIVTRRVPVVPVVLPRVQERIPDRRAEVEAAVLSEGLDLREGHDRPERVDVHGAEAGGDDPDGPAVDQLLPGGRERTRSVNAGRVPSMTSS